MSQFVTYLQAQRLAGRCALVGMILAGGAGAIVGLVVGLHVHAATAWFAMLEVGVPAAIAGGTVGALLGWAVVVADRARRRPS